TVCLPVLAGDEPDPRLRQRLGQQLAPGERCIGGIPRVRERHTAAPEKVLVSAREQHWRQNSRLAQWDEARIEDGCQLDLGRLRSQARGRRGCYFFLLVRLGQEPGGPGGQTPFALVVIG